MNERFPIPNALNAVVIAVQLAAFALLVSFGTRQRGWLLALCCVGFALLMNSVYSTLHEAEHGILFTHRRVNDAAGVVLALLFPAPFHLLRQGHLGHHQRNRSDDESFDFWFDGEHPLWKRVQFYGILTGFYWAVVVLSNIAVLVMGRLFDRRNFAFDRPSAAFMDALNPKYWRWVRLEGLAAILLHAAIVAAIDGRALPYAFMYCAFGFTWSAMQYVHHFGTERDVLNGARNLWIAGPVDAIWLNHNWHLTHHRHPTVPWLHLPRVAAGEGITARGFLPAAYIRMWRGPRYTAERVENRYAGRVIR